MLLSCVFLVMRNSTFFGIALAVIGIAIAVIGFNEKGLAAAASATPEEISLAKLIARGPDGNPNIILTDYVLCDNFVFQTRNGSWQNAWVPAVPREGQPGGFPNVGIPPGIPGRAGRPAVIQALIFTIKARDENSLFQLCEQPRLPALVTNRIMSLGGEERRLLEQSYPGTDFSRCLIIQQGREPAGATKLIFMIGGGSLAALAGFGLLGFALVRWQRERNTSSRRARDDDDDEDVDRPRKRRIRSQDPDDDDRPARRRSRREPDDEDAPPRRRSRREDPDDVEEDRPARRRRRDDDPDDERPHRRSRSSDYED